MSIGVRITTLDGMTVDFKTYAKYLSVKDNYILHSFDDKPACVVYHNNGVVSLEEWHKDGRLHRDNDRPSYIRYNSDGRLHLHAWHKEGEVHRDNDKPAIINFTEEGNIWCESWYKENKLYRDNGLPTRIEYVLNDPEQVYSESWHKDGKEITEEEAKEITQMIELQITTLDGKTLEFEVASEYYETADKYILHSFDDKPARIVYNKDGTISQYVWYKEGNIHRDNDQPASLSYCATGHIEYQIWYKDGKFHRDNGLPAYIEYNISNPEQIYCEKWYNEDREITKEEAQIFTSTKKPRIYKNFKDYWRNGKHGCSNCNREYARQIWDDIEPSLLSTRDEAIRILCEQIYEKEQRHKTMVHEMLTYLSEIGHTSKFLTWNRKKDEQSR